MDHWEYCTLEQSDTGALLIQYVETGALRSSVDTLTPNTFEGQIAHLGSEAWELVSVSREGTRERWHFKRSVTELSPRHVL